MNNGFNVKNKAIGVIFKVCSIATFINSDEMELFFGVTVHRQCRLVKYRTHAERNQIFFLLPKKHGRNDCILNNVPHLHSHLWRRTRAMHLHIAGVSLPLISEWLGHSNEETTLSLESRESNDYRSFGELFLYFSDEMSDITWTQAFQMLLQVFRTMLTESTELSDGK